MSAKSRIYRTYPCCWLYFSRWTNKLHISFTVISGLTRSHSSDKPRFRVEICWPARPSRDFSPVFKSHKCQSGPESNVLGGWLCKMFSSFQWWFFSRYITEICLQYEVVLDEKKTLKSIHISCFCTDCQTLLLLHQRTLESPARNHSPNFCPLK